MRADRGRVAGAQRRDGHGASPVARPVVPTLAGLGRSAARRAARPHDGAGGEARHDDLRRLAVWLARRREVDEVLEVLTQYGPTANDRVAGHLAALEVMLDAEREAFDALRRGRPGARRSGRCRPCCRRSRTRQPANVHSLLAARLVRGSSRPELGSRPARIRRAIPLSLRSIRRTLRSERTQLAEARPALEDAVDGREDLAAVDVVRPHQQRGVADDSAHRGADLHARDAGDLLGHQHHVGACCRASSTACSQRVGDADHAEAGLVGQQLRHDVRQPLVPVGEEHGLRHACSGAHLGSASRFLVPGDVDERTVSGRRESNPRSQFGRLGLYH